MSKIIREATLKPGFRVTIREIDFALPYQIQMEQHWQTHSDRPHWDHDSDGWRSCTVVWAMDLDEADQKFMEMVESEKRWIN